MVRGFGVAMAVLAASLVLAPAVLAQNSPGVQALEAQLREAERAGLDGPDIQKLRDMLEALKAEEAESPPDGADTRTMRPNHFDAMNKSGYGDCSQYDDRQAFAFCASAGNAFQSYLTAFNEGAGRPQLRVLYDAHVMSAENLVVYVDGGRAPDTRSAGEADGGDRTARTQPGDESGRDDTARAAARETEAETGVDDSPSVTFDRIDTGEDGGSMTTTSKGRVYEPQPETYTGEKGWFSDRDRTIFLARLEAVNAISSACTKKGARADRPSTDQIRAGDAPPRWTYSVPDCRQGGWKDEEWNCRATVAGHCYWD